MKEREMKLYGFNMYYYLKKIFLVELFDFVSKKLSLVTPNVI